MRIKMRLVKRGEDVHGTDPVSAVSATLEFRACVPDDHEVFSFGASGALELAGVDRAVAQRLTLGADYDVDITPAVEATIRPSTRYPGTF